MDVRPPDFPFTDLSGDTTTESSGISAAPIGAYRLLQKIGEGGMGEVWLADQLQPVRRQVAVKLIRRGMDSQYVLARFEAERQALAVMDHPAIATVFDGGTTPDGRPYFAMEYVKGEPITAYCNRVRLSTDERLRLFVEVCEGVQHAHQKGVIHRDLKPSNLLVAIREDRPIPKIIDFGVAKAIAQPLTDRTLHTVLGSMLGTPEYMSPEQTESGGLDVDTRTDVYALGVILYELLTGALPLVPTDVQRASVSELSRLIRSHEPSRPSTRVTQLGAEAGDVASSRRTDLAKLAGRLRGDLDWITMKALDKDRTRRYATASGLAADILHHLNHEPVTAGPPSATYRAGKFIRRHRFGVAAGAIGAATLVVVAVALAVQAERIARERDRANHEAARANQEAAAARHVTDFLVGLFKVSDPSESRGNVITAREILDKGAVRVEADLSSQPEVQGRLMSTMATVYQSLGLFKEAVALLEKSLAIRRRALGNSHADVAETLHNLGTVKIQLGEFDAAATFLSEALAMREQLLGADSIATSETRGSLGFLAYQRGDYDKAESFYRRRLDVLRTASSDRSGEAISDTLNDLAMCIQQARGDYAQAKVLLREALDIRSHELGKTHPKIGQSLNNLAMAHYRSGEFEAAEPLFREALQRNRAAFGDRHPEVAAASSNLALVLRERQQYGAANALWMQVLDIDRQFLGSDHPNVASALMYLGESVRRAGDARAAEARLREAIAILTKTFPENHWQHARPRSGLALCLVDQRRFAEAETLILDAYRLIHSQFAAFHPRVKEVVERAIVLYEAWDKPQKADEWRARLPATAQLK